MYVKWICFDSFPLYSCSPALVFFVMPSILKGGGGKGENDYFANKM